MKQYTKEELYKMDAITLYKMVLSGKTIKKFPDGFWKQPEVKQNAAKCTKFLIEEILKYNEEQLKEKNSTSLFMKNKLGGMLNACFSGSPYEAINNAYPNKFKQWEFKNVPIMYWTIDNGIKATKWLIEEKLRLTDEELRNTLSKNLFKDNKLLSMLIICFNGSPYKAINTIYPNKFHEWEFKYVSKGYWTINTGIKATKWLIEDKLQLNDEQLKEQLNQSLFIENGLNGMLSTCFNNSPYEAINSAYPNKFKEWEFKNVPIKYWKDKNNAISATKWLIEDKLQLNDEQLKEQFSQKLFRDNELAGMLKYCFNGSPYKAINATYPGKFKEWEFKNVPMNYWMNKENGIKATKWLIEEKLKLNDEQLKEQLSRKLFINNKLNGMLSACFNNSPYKAINSAYPNKFKEWEFKNVPMKYWMNKENSKKATRWLIEEKLKLTDKQLKEQLSINLFRDNELGSMLSICFNNSPSKAIKNAYPNKVF